MYDKFKVMAAVVLLGAALLISPATAAAAAPAGRTIQNIETADCLDQHFNAQGRPTTTVFAWPEPCHSQGNQHWQFFEVDTKAYVVVNTRSEWCLSAPNGAGSRVYAEVCSYPIPNKQIWLSIRNSTGSKFLYNRLSGQCMEQGPGADLYVAKCVDKQVATQKWYGIPV